MNHESCKKIVFILGTKAQFIKSKYVLESLINRDYSLLIVDTGQHREITQKELSFFKNNYELISLSNNKSNIDSIPKMIFWFFNIIFFNIKIPQIQNTEYCLVHGDTLSTLIGMIIGKRNKLKVVHIESGFSSGNIFKPFPEEIVRYIVSRFSDILCFDEYVNSINKSRYRNKKQVITISRNTIYDSVVKNIESHNIKTNDNLITTIHRTENIYNKRLLKQFINLLLEINQTCNFENIIWYTHDITFKALKKNNFIEELKNNGIQLKPLITYKQFTNEIYSSKAIITDGGSIAEECSILNKKTVIWRDVEEKIDNLNSSVFLSKYNNKKIIKFLNEENVTYKLLPSDISPSSELVQKLLDL